MPEVGVVPAPDSPYVELGGTGQPRRFSKHILTVGETFVHPASGKPLTVDESWWADLKKNWDDKVVPICQFPAADERNRHTENPLMNLGRVVDLRRQGQKIYADVEVPDPAVADKVGKTILGASAMLHMDYPDPRSGRRRGKALVHVAATNHPHLISLEPYSELAASSTELHEVLPDGSVLAPHLLMLCADQTGYAPVMLAEPEPDYPPEPAYGGPDMHDEFLRDELARLGLDAMAVSSGRPSKPAYDHVKLEQERRERQAEPAYLSAVESLRTALPPGRVERTPGEVCSAFALQLSARPELTARADRPISMTTIMTAARQSAFEKDEATANDPEAIAAELIGMSNELGGTDDPASLALTADSESERIIGLARHPSRSDEMVTTRTRAHTSELDEDPSDEDQPARGGDVHKKVRELIERHPDLLTDGKGHEGGSGNCADGPKSAAQREREEVRAQAGRPGGRSIGDLSRGSARTRAGR